MTSVQLDLFAEAERCKTCGTERPANHPRVLFLEPVSGECFDCNHATVDEILRGPEQGDLAAYGAARLRHYPRGARPRRTGRKGAA
jgi:hypothetical protein